MTKTKRRAAKTKTAEEWPEIEVLTDLEQVKVLADPLRLRILEALCEKARTTKQVAELLGEKPTKLYHHVDALERTGLIRLETTRQKRGTLEKYYRAIARSFRADSQLFSPASPAQGPPDGWQEVAASLLEKTAGDVRRLEGKDAGPSLDEKKLLFAGLRIRASTAVIAELLNELESWLEKAQELNTEDGEEDFSMTVAFYPVKPNEKG